MWMCSASADTLFTFLYMCCSFRNNVMSSIWKDLLGRPWTAISSSYTVSAIPTVHLNCLLRKLNSVISSYCPPELPPPQVEQCQQLFLSAWTACSTSWTVSAVLTVRLNCLLRKLNSVSNSFCPPELPLPQVEQCQEFLLSAWTASSTSWTVSATLSVRLNCLLLKLNSVSSSFCPPELPPPQVEQCQQFFLSTGTASSSSWAASAVLTFRLNCVLLNVNSVFSPYSPSELPPPQVERCQHFLQPMYVEWRSRDV